MTENKDRQRPRSKSVVSIFYGRRPLVQPVPSLSAALIPEKVLAASQKPSFDVEALRQAVTCDISLPSDKDFKDKVYGGLWNRYYANRAPQVAVHVKTDADVIAAVKFAKANNMKVAVRGGGHNWCAPSLRNGGMMIDLTAMNKVISIDPVKKIAVCQSRSLATVKFNRNSNRMA
jgi:hypothetical protein